MDIKKFYAICLQGNVLEAIEYLKSFETKNDEVIKLEKQYEERFFSSDYFPEIDSEDPWVKDVLNCYFSYFRSVLTNNSIEESEKKLISRLSKLVNITDDSDLDRIEAELEKIFNRKGYSFLGGVTLPFRGPYIWKTTRKKEFSVLLPFSEQKVTVYFISDFLLLSWAHFATMGNKHTGGWANDEGLYYVNNEKKEVDTDSVDFQVWFLKHEAQHLSDYKEFPELNACSLEYRAKLVEVIYHTQPYSVIERYINQSKNDETVPHSYAAYSIIKHLSGSIFDQEYVDDKQKWESIASDLISKSAYNLLVEDNNRLHNMGTKSKQPGPK